MYYGSTLSFFEKSDIVQKIEVIRDVVRKYAKMIGRENYDLFMFETKKFQQNFNVVIIKLDELYLSLENIFMHIDSLRQ